MTGQSATKRTPIARVVHNPARHRTLRNMETRASGRFEVGEPVRAVAVIKNDGMYPHKDIGEALVHPGDTGVVRESWRFLGEIYYTVEFVTKSVFVIMRGGEMTRMGTAFDVRA